MAWPIAPQVLRADPICERLMPVRQLTHAAQPHVLTNVNVFSPDGQWIVLRTEQALIFYRASDLLAGNWREAGREALTALGEPQGEGVTFGPDNSLYLMSEGGGKKRPGAFGRLTCTLGS